MFSLLWKWLLSIFTADKIGILVRALLINAGSKLMVEILNVQNQKKAYEFVKELASRKDLTNAQKAKEFNKKMLEYAKKAGKVLSESVLNCLRELAVNAFKAEQEKQ